MKKVIMLAAVVAALASCQSKANKAAEAQADSLALAMTPITELTEVYEGTLPAADGPGIDYVLTLNAATDGVDTTYTLDMTYLDDVIIQIADSFLQAIVHQTKSGVIYNHEIHRSFTILRS